GSFDYVGPPKSGKKFVDNYHTGFNMRMLYSIWKLTNDEAIKTSLDNCYTHYMNNFFEGPIPKFTPERLYRVDIHSVSECVHCLCTLSPEYPQGIQYAKETLHWAIKELQHKSGWFYHGIFLSRIFKKPFKSKIPYMRWAQAWMFRAFTTVSMYDSFGTESTKSLA
ncbi:MAG: hypothetical protein AAGA77_00775, partial [Bacteroidota bacterium]